MSFNKEQQYAFKIHSTLLDEIKRAVQSSIENEIKKRQNCICSDNNNCQCISKFLGRNFDPNQINSRSQSQKRNFKELDLKIAEIYKNNNNNYLNNLDIFDFTSYFSLTRHLLQINPKNGWENIYDLDEMTKDLSFGGCLNNIRNIRNNFYGHLTNYLIEYENFERIIDIFNKVTENLPTLDVKFKDQTR